MVWPAGLFDFHVSLCKLSNLEILNQLNWIHTLQPQTFIPCTAATDQSNICTVFLWKLHPCSNWSRTKAQPIYFIVDDIADPMKHYPRRAPSDESPGIDECEQPALGKVRPLHVSDISTITANKRHFQKTRVYNSQQKISAAWFIKWKYRFHKYFSNSLASGDALATSITVEKLESTLLRENLIKAIHFLRPKGQTFMSPDNAVWKMFMHFVSGLTHIQARIRLTTRLKRD